MPEDGAESINNGPTPNTDTATKPTGNFSNPNNGANSYYGLSNGIFGSMAQQIGRLKTCRPSDVTDGTSKTIMIGERDGSDNGGSTSTTWNGGYQGGIWIGPDKGKIPNAVLGQAGFDPKNRLQSSDPAAKTWGYASVHRGGASFCMADGAVKWINAGIDPQAYKAMGTRNETD